ncbi:hypothetical protein ASPCAL03703 [Aspergillus calidoustus]|uniref:Uncharacterized protein n=1 Tax=Aspergillus calidoustus TaxID=454130 RepID=A0A0U5FTF2_ASPCI|nr:hypothetical protein ASPCAL03703 [Aspergillus calidoustus]
MTVTKTQALPCPIGHSLALTSPLTLDDVYAHELSPLKQLGLVLFVSGLTANINRLSNMIKHHYTTKLSQSYIGIDYGTTILGYIH